MKSRARRLHVVDGHPGEVVPERVRVEAVRGEGLAGLGLGWLLDEEVLLGLALAATNEPRLITLAMAVSAASGPQPALALTSVRKSVAPMPGFTFTQATTAASISASRVAFASSRLRSLRARGSASSRALSAVSRSPWSSGTSTPPSLYRSSRTGSFFNSSSSARRT